jgi:hypothetical protein
VWKKTQSAAVLADEYLRKSILLRRNRGINFANGRAFLWRLAAFDMEALPGAGPWPGIWLRTVVLRTKRIV